MKKQITLLLLLLSALCHYVLAQQDIQHSIYFKEKYCIASDFAPIRYYLSHSNGNVYATHTYYKKLHISKVKNNWDTI